MLFSDFSNGGEETEAQQEVAKRGIDVNDLRKRRQQQSVQIRKNRREDQLRKRRQCKNSEEEMASKVDETQVKESQIAAKLSALPLMLDAVRNRDNSKQYEGIRAVRRLLSQERAPPVKEVLDAGFLQYLCTFLKSEDNKLKFESAWALTNIASTDYTRVVVDANILPDLAPLLLSADSQVREQAIWLLGNVAGDCTEFRDIVVKSDECMHGMLLNLTQPASVEMLRTAVWAVSNLARGNKPRVNLERIKPFIEVLARVAAGCDDEASCVDVCWALSYVSDGDDKRIETVTSTGVVKTLISFLQGDSKAVAPALRTVGNIVSGTEEATQTVIDEGFLAVLGSLLHAEKSSVRKEAAWAASNITAGSKTQIGSFLAMPGLIESIVQIFEEDDYQIKKEAAYAICNAITGGSHEFAMCLVERHNILKGLSQLLGDCKDGNLIRELLKSLAMVLSIKTESYCSEFEEYNGVEHLENLLQHEDEQIQNESAAIFDMYFNVDDEDDNLNFEAPTLDKEGGFFKFGVSNEEPQMAQPEAGTGFLNFSSVSFD